METGNRIQFRAVVFPSKTFLGGMETAVDVAGENEPFRIDTRDVISIVDSVLNNNLTQERFAPVRPGVLRRMLGRLRRLFGCRSYIEFRLTRRT